MGDFTILINSCYKFSDMWNNIDVLYNRFWVNHPALYIVTDKNDVKKNIDNLLCFDLEMTNRIIESIKTIKTKYVFFSFDDYYPIKEVNDNAIRELISIMEEQNIDYCRIFDDPKIKGKKIGELGYSFLSLNRIYEVNFYPSIWKKESLLSVLKENEEIWKAEARITKRAKEQNLKCICVKQKKIFPFIDVVRKGKYLRNAYRYLKKSKLYISDRDIRTIRETIALDTQIFVSNHAPMWLKNRIKNRLRRKGKVFYSDYENNE